MPPKAAEREGARHPISFRTTPEARARLEAAASHSGRSLTQELEWRLERTFSDEDVLVQVLGGKRGAEIVRAVGMAVQGTIARVGDDPDVNVNMQVSAALVAMAQAIAGCPAEQILNAASSTSDKRKGDLSWRTAATSAVSLYRKVSLATARRQIERPGLAQPSQEVQDAEAAFKPDDLASIMKR